MQRSIFKVGDRVWCAKQRRWGEVVNVTFNSEYPIRVNFSKISYSIYTLEGKLDKNDKLPTLGFKEIELPKDFQTRLNGRLEKGSKYFYVTPELTVGSVMDYYTKPDSILFAIGNYFKTRKEAEDKVKEIIEKCFKN